MEQLFSLVQLSKKKEKENIKKFDFDFFQIQNYTASKRLIGYRPHIVLSVERR